MNNGNMIAQDGLSTISQLISTIHFMSDNRKMVKITERSASARIQFLSDNRIWSDNQDLCECGNVFAIA